MPPGSEPEISPQVRRPLIELIAVAMLLTVDLWWLRTLASPLPAAVAAAVVGGIVVTSYLRRKRHDSTSTPGRSGLAPGWRDTAVFTALALAVVIALSAWARSEPYDEIRLYATQWPLPKQLGVGAIGLGRALVQQVLLLGFLWPVTLEVTRRESLAGFLVASFFAAAHLPNPYLAVGTLVLGAAWIWLYRRGAAFSALIASHVLLAATAFAFLPERTLGDLHVGSKAVVRAARYEIYRDLEKQEILRRACTPGGDLSTASGDPPPALIEEILGRPATEFEIGKWEYRDRYLSRCAAAKRLLMSAK